MNTGIVRFFNQTKGYGFILDSHNNEEYFFHKSTIKSKEPVYEGALVEYDVYEAPKGREARNVTIK